MGDGEGGGDYFMRAVLASALSGAMIVRRRTCEAAKLGSLGDCQPAQPGRLGGRWL